MSRLPRVAFVVPTMSVGGTEVQVLRLIKGLRDDFEVTLICMREGGALIGDARRAGAYVRMLYGRGGWDFRVEWKLRRVLYSHTPHIIHSFLFGFDLWANRAARHAGIPVIVSSRRELATWKKRRHLMMQRWANRHVDTIVANSAAAADFAAKQEGMPRDRYQVIHNGIPAEDYVSRIDNRQLRKRYRIAPGMKVIGMVANFSPVKDHALFVKMAELLLKKDKDLRFIFVGTGPLLEQVHNMIEKRGIRTHFDRIITVSEMADVLAVFDVAVLCSKVEGFPNAIMEAMAAGRPVVAADVGGIRELVRDGETGRLIASRDPHDWAAAVSGLLENPGEAAAMALRASEWVRREFSVERMVQNYRDLYYTLLRGKSLQRTIAPPAGGNTES